VGAKALWDAQQSADERFGPLFAWRSERLPFATWNRFREFSKVVITAAEGVDECQSQN
jgi:hypothetical protein